MKNLYVILFLYLSIKLMGQNLIPNPGFDMLSNCPEEGGQIYLAVSWGAANNGTPDLFNECSQDHQLQVPNAGTYIDSYQEQRSGTGYAGIVVYFNANLPGNEYMETELTSPMKEGRQYYIEFYVSPDLSPTHKWRYTDAVGLALTEDFYYEEIEAHSAMSLEPVMENRGTLITDTLGWTRISGCYIAKGKERFAIIGNFRDENETIIEVENPNSYPYLSYFFIEDVSIIPFDPLPDTALLCEDGTLNLDASFLDAAYRWNTGSTDSVLVVTNPGEYTVEVFMENCILEDTVLVMDVKNNIGFPQDTFICKDESFILKAGLPGIYEWSDGSNESQLPVLSSGDYSLTITNECGAFYYDTNVNVEECGCEMLVPNVFSPNNDGVNDYLEIFAACDYDYKITAFRIFDRWGSCVYATHNEAIISWNGTRNEKILQQGVYVWFLEYEIVKSGVREQRLEKGNVTIVR